MNTIFYAIDALSPAAFVVWMRLAALSENGIPYSDNPEVLARICRMTPKRFGKIQDEIAAAGLDDVDPFTESFTVCESRQQNSKRNSQSGAERMRRFRARKASQSDATVTECDVDVTSHVTVCDVTQSSPVTDSDVTSDGDVTQRRGSSLSSEVSPAPLPNSNPILPREVNSSAPACESSLADLEIIPPDPSAIRSAVSGMLGGVLVPMSDTPAEPATTPPANAETTGQSAILPPAIRQSRTTHPMESDHGENPSRSATPVPAGGAGTGPVKPRRSPRISPQLQSEFDRFWDVCPRKVGKGAALKAYAAARQLESEPTLLEAMQSYARSRDGEDPQYTCHPATWLNQGRWDDEIPPNPALRGGDVGPSVIRPGKRASSDPVEDAYQAEMAEIAERERRERHVH